MAEEGSC